MKLVILGKWPSEDIIGGVANHTQNLVRSLSEQNEIELSVISFADKSKIIKHGNAKIIFIKSSRLYYLLPFLTIFKLFKVIKNEKIDIIHLQGSNLSPYLIITSLLKYRYPISIMVLGIVRIESRYKEESKLPIYSFLNKIAEKHIITQSKNIIVATESIKRIISKWTKANIYVISSGIDLKKFNTIQLKSLSEKSDVLIISRLEKLKGIDLVIKATSMLINEFPDIKILIAGTGSEEEELKYLVKKLKLEKYIRFLGFISDEEKYKYYNASKYVVIPSRWDCQPITLFEAAASGKPVIISDMSNHEIIIEGKTGLIFKSDNVNDLVSNMKILLKNPILREQMGKTAKDYIKKYDWNKISKKYVDVYKKVINDFYKK
jgi:glycosyltransferase involved in cell wall biosynthesis